MNDIINLYCDESCHLEHDGQKVMVLGALWCPKDKARDFSDDLRQIKMKHHLSRTFEVKWTKVSPAKVDFYADIIDYFFGNAGLHFRAVVIDKAILDHEHHEQTHDDFYYKMYFDLLKVIIDPQKQYRIYLDIKDTHSNTKVAKLHEVLTNAHYDFERTIIERIQTVSSHEVELIQLTDLLVGAVSYANRALATSEAKCMLVNRMKERSHYSLTRNTLLREEKVNILCWQPRGDLT